jgi:hypothetical protein
LYNGGPLVTTPTFGFTYLFGSTGGANVPGVSNRELSIRMWFDAQQEFFPCGPGGTCWIWHGTVLGEFWFYLDLNPNTDLFSIEENLLFDLSPLDPLNHVDGDLWFSPDVIQIPPNPGHGGVSYIGCSFGGQAGAGSYISPEVPQAGGSAFYLELMSCRTAIFRQVAKLSLPAGISGQINFQIHFVGNMLHSAHGTGWFFMSKQGTVNL